MNHHDVENLRLERVRQQARKPKLKPWVTPTLAILAIFAVLAGGAVAYSYFEARAYNRLTGANVTTWDALVLDLRVQDQPRNER